MVRFSLNPIVLGASLKISWVCRHTWFRATKNTLWCLAGCSIGDLGTIGVFQILEIPWPSSMIFLLAIINGIITSIVLEVFVLLKQMSWKFAFRTALGMSLISMVSMELAMNLVDLAVNGSAKLSLGVLPLMLMAGFITPLPYNYWRLKKLGRSCH